MITQSRLFANLINFVLLVQGFEHPFNEVLHHRHSLKEYLLDRIQYEIKTNTNVGESKKANSLSNSEVLTGFDTQGYAGSPSGPPTITPRISPTGAPTLMPTFSPSTFSPSVTPIPTRMPFVKLRDDDHRKTNYEGDDWHPVGFTDDDTIPSFWLYITRFDSLNCNKTQVVATSGLHSGACIRDDSYNEFASFILRGTSCENVEIDVFADNNCATFLYNKFLRNAVTFTLGSCYAENTTAGVGNDAYTRRIDCSMTSALPIITRSAVKLTHGYGSGATCSAAPIEFTAISSDVCFSENGGYSERYSCNLDSPVDLKYFGSNGICTRGSNVHSDVNISFHQGCYTNGHYNGNHVPQLPHDSESNDEQRTNSRASEQKYREAEASLAAALRHEDVFQRYDPGRDDQGLTQKEETPIIKLNRERTSKTNSHRTLEAVSVFKNTVDNDDFYTNNDDQYGDDDNNDGFYNDDDSHDIFYADDNFDDAYGFDDDVALDNKLFETLHCFQLESYAPTVRPTMRPSKSRSPSAVPTVQIVPVISFDVLINLTGLLNTTLDPMSERALGRTVDSVLNVSDDTSLFLALLNVTTRTIDDGDRRLSSTGIDPLETIATGRSRRLADAVVVSAVAKIHCILDLQLYNNLDPQLFFESLGDRLANATVFTSTMRSIAQSMGAQVISSVSTVARSVSLGPLSIQLPPTMGPTIAPTISPTYRPSSEPATLLTTAVISGVVVGSLVFLLCCIGGVYFFGYYGPRERTRIVAITDHHLV